MDTKSTFMAAVAAILCMGVLLIFSDSAVATAKATEQASFSGSPWILGAGLFGLIGVHSTRRN